MVWDTDSAPGIGRTIRVVGKRGSFFGFLTCQAVNYTGGGNLASQSASRSIYSTSWYSGIDLVLDNVPAGSFALVYCAMSADNAIIQGIDYAQ